MLLQVEYIRTGEGLIALEYHSDFGVYAVNMTDGLMMYILQGGQDYPLVILQ